MEKHVRGWIKTDNFSKDDNSDESEDDDADESWIDFSLTMDDSRIARSKPPKLRKVVVMDINGGKHSCNGRFPYTNSFWCVDVRVAKTWLKAPPVYRIRTDTAVDRHMVNIFIHDCLERPDKFKSFRLDQHTINGIKACFDAFLQNRLGNMKVNFINLPKIFEMYLETEKQKCCLLNSGSGKDAENQNHSLDIQSGVMENELGNTLLNCATHPHLVEVLCLLLPNSFSSILSKLKTPQNLSAADQMAQTCPWELGFKRILSSKLQVYGVEAPLTAFIKAGMLQDIPQYAKDALYIYEALKADSKKDGHMYTSFSRLKATRHFKTLKYPITTEQRWTEALNYLETNDVVKIEQFNQDTNIFLTPNWEAEVNTVKVLEKIFVRHYNDRLIWDVDLNSPDFDNMRSDPDQMRALHMMINQPIAVLSGKGGCGKTTVVTKLLEHLCNKLKTSQEDSQLSQIDTNVVLENGKLEAMNTDSDNSNLAFLKAEPVCTGERESLTAENHPKDLQQEMKPSTSRANQTETTVDSPEVGNLDHTSSDNAGGNDSAQNGVNAVPNNTESAPDTTTSKTTMFKQQVVNDLIKLLERNRPSDSPEVEDFKASILLTAPTGKAARLLGCKSHLPSATLHSISVSHRMFLKAMKTHPQEWKYGQVQVLVVDECSLVSVQLFAHVSNLLLEHADLRKIILLGDIRQLPSIQPGDFLKDVFNTLSRVGNHRFGFSVELMTNHRSESRLIIENAGLIAHKCLPTVDSSQRFHFIKIRDDSDSAERAAVIRKLLRTSEDMKSDVTSQFVSFRNCDCDIINELCCDHYNQHSLKEAVQAGGKAHYKFEIGDKVCLKRNFLIENYRQKLLSFYQEDFPELDKIVNGIREREKKEKSEGQDEEEKAKEGKYGSGNHLLNKSVLDATAALDLITGDEDQFNETLGEMKTRDEMVKENRAMKMREDKLQKANEQSQNWREMYNICQNLGDTKEKLCNGEVFFIMDEKEEVEKDKHMHYVVLSDRDPVMPRIVCVDMKELKSKCQLRHSWCRTIHTYQGSESDVVVYVIGTPIPQNWQHVYTAVTRGRKAVYIVGKWEHLQKTLERTAWPRNSHLAVRLKEMLKDNDDIIQFCQRESNISPPPSQLSQLSQFSQFSQPSQQSTQNPADQDDFDTDGDNLLLTFVEEELETTTADACTAFSNNSASVFSPTKLKNRHQYSNKTPEKHKMSTDQFNVGISPCKRLFEEPSTAEVDTPFRQAFASSLSMSQEMDDEQKDSQQSQHSQELTNVRRKL